MISLVFLVLIVATLSHDRLFVGEVLGGAGIWFFEDSCDRLPVLCPVQ